MKDPKDAKAIYNGAGMSRVVYTEEEEKKAREEGFTLSHAELPFALREYPKGLHLNGDKSLAVRVVANDDEERAARAEGFKMIDKDADAKAVARLSESKLAEEKPAAKKGK